MGRKDYQYSTTQLQNQPTFFTHIQFSEFLGLLKQFINTKILCLQRPPPKHYPNLHNYSIAQSQHQLHFPSPYTHRSTKQSIPSLFSTKQVTMRIPHVESRKKKVDMQQPCLTTILQFLSLEKSYDRFKGSQFSGFSYFYNSRGV